jgi:hypothetical protein
MSFMIPDSIKVTIDGNSSHSPRLAGDVEILLLDEVHVTDRETVDFACVDASGRKHCVSMTQNLLRKLGKVVTPSEEKV